MPRPKSKNPRSIMVNIRLTKRESERVRALAAIRKIVVSEFIRLCIKKVRPDVFR